MQFDSGFKPSQQSISNSTVASIRAKCSQFLSESNGKPIFKRLDWTYGDFSKVKVRHSPTYSTYHVLDEAFATSIENTLVPVTTQPLDNITNTDDWYYVFPVDGYKYLYSNQIVEYRYQVDKLMSRLKDRDMVVDVMKESYTHNENLPEGIQSCLEILLYNIPSFYVASCSLYPDYPALLSSIT